LIKVVEEDSGVGVTLSFRLWLRDLKICGAISQLCYDLARNVQQRDNFTFIIMALDSAPGRYLLLEHRYLQPTFLVREAIVSNFVWFAGSFLRFAVASQ
jgi:hypothetical protein